jgi:uncharacterized protein (DUF1684 family)
MASPLLSRPPAPRLLPRRVVARFVLTFASASAFSVACNREPALPSITPAEHAKAWETWKVSRTKWLSTPNRAQSYTGLRWIHEGATTIGGDSGNDVMLAGRGVPARVGTLVREGHRVRFDPAPGAAVTIDTQPATAGWLRLDGDSGGPSNLGAGSAGFRIIRRVDSVGVRMWDADLVTPEALARTIAPLDYFPLQPEWRLPARLIPAAKPETLAVPTNSGVAEEYVLVGTISSRVGNAPVSLTAFAGSKPNDLFLSFSDETSGEETYGFRFLHAALDTVTKVVTLDFNYAYNPECAFSKFTTCPLPPEGNRIPVRIPAGEKVVKHLHEASPLAKVAGDSQAKAPK